jgi:hypothetical protein
MQFAAPSETMRPGEKELVMKIKAVTSFCPLLTCVLAAVACGDSPQATPEKVATDEEAILDGTMGGNYVDFVLGGAVTRDAAHGAGPGVVPNCCGSIGYIPNQTYDATLGSTELDLANTAGHCAGTRADTLVFQQWKISGKKVATPITGWQRATADNTKIGQRGDYMNAAICPALFRTAQMWGYTDAMSLGGVRNQRGYRNLRLIKGVETPQADDRQNYYVRDGYPRQIGTSLLYRIYDGAGGTANPLVIGNPGDSGGPLLDVAGDTLVGIHRGRNGNPPGGFSLGTWITKNYALAVRGGTLVDTEAEYDDTGVTIEPEVYTDNEEADAEDPRTTAIGDIIKLGCYKVTIDQAASTNNIDSIAVTAASANAIGKMPPGSDTRLPDNSVPRMSYPSFPPAGTVTLTATVTAGNQFTRWAFTGDWAAAACNAGNTVNPCTLTLPTDAGGEIKVTATAAATEENDDGGVPLGDDGGAPSGDDGGAPSGDDGGVPSGDDGGSPGPDAAMVVDDAGSD